MNLIIIAILAILAIYVSKAHHLKQKFTIVAVIVLLMLVYVSYSSFTKGYDLDYKSISGFEKGAKLYFSWLGHAFGNFKVLTGNAVKMDWDLDKNSTAKK